MERLRIGELLVQSKLISPERLEDALLLQRSQGRKLGQVLIDLGIVNETQLTQALSLQLSVPWVSLYHIDFSRQLLNLVPREVAERYGLIPIFVRRVRKQGETLYVAMDDPTHEAALEAVAASASLPVRPMIAAPSDIRSAIRVYYYDARDPASTDASADPGAALVESPTVATPMTVRSIGSAPSSAGAAEAAPQPPAPAPPRVAMPRPPEGPELENLRAAVLEPERAPSPSASSEPPSPSSSTGDSPDAWPEVEARTLELPLRKGGPKMVALTLLDGTTIQLPAKPRRRHEEPGAERETPHGFQFLATMTARDLIKALVAVAEGGDAREVFGDKVPLEAIAAALLSLLLRKGVIADWEFVEELRKKR